MNESDLLKMQLSEDELNEITQMKQWQANKEKYAFRDRLLRVIQQDEQFFSNYALKQIKTTCDNEIMKRRLEAKKRWAK